MTFEACVYKDRDIPAGMAVLASFRIGFMQNIPYQCGPVTAVGIVTGTAFAQFGREIRMFLLDRRSRVTFKAKRLGFLYEKICIR